VGSAPTVKTPYIKLQQLGEKFKELKMTEVDNAPSTIPMSVSETTEESMMNFYLK
jgi:hypothetical protein